MNNTDIEDKTVAVLGYGSQGHALNMDEPEVDVIVELPEDSSSRDDEGSVA